MEKESLFWVSLIVQETKESMPWLCSISTGFLNIDDAYKEIQFKREHYRVLSAWIDVFDENNVKQTILHECYIDTLGNISKNHMKYYVLTSRVETTMETPAIFSSSANAHEQMEREFNDRLSALKADETKVIYSHLGSDEASIESDEYFEWNINDCFVDELTE